MYKTEDRGTFWTDKIETYICLSKYFCYLEKNAEYKWLVHGVASLQESTAVRVMSDVGQ
jgi:hypothetical protein